MKIVGTDSTPLNPKELSELLAFLKSEDAALFAEVSEMIALKMVGQFPTLLRTLYDEMVAHRAKLRQPELFRQPRTPRPTAR